MAGVKDWLQLFRAQTAFATIYCITIPYLIAGGDIRNLIILIPLGFLFHYLGLGHNNLMDYWYDVHDPNKQHHPLIKGTIPLHKAHIVIHYGMVFTSIASAALAFYISPAPALAIFGLLLHIVWGHAYNDGLDKQHSHSWFPIAMCYAGLMLFGWFMASSSFSITALLLYIWIIAAILYQIGWEGNLKDVWNPSERLNLARQLGVKTITKDGTTYIVAPTHVNMMFAFVRAVAESILILLMAWSLNALNIIFLVGFTITMIPELYAVDKIYAIVSGKEPLMPLRQNLLEAFGIAEAFNFFRVITVYMATSITALIIGLALIAAGMLYFVALNKYLWGSRFGPKV